MLVTTHHVNRKHAEVLTPVAETIQEALDALQQDPYCTPSDKANFADTAVRAAKAWRQVYSIGVDDVSEAKRRLTAYTGTMRTKADVYRELTSILATGFPTDSDDSGIVTQGPITAHSLCPHHLLPVAYEVFVAYRPTTGGQVLGLSKLARVAIALAQRPVLQEQLSADIADTLYYDGQDSSQLPQIQTAGSAVHLIGAHSCMACRGVKSNALTVTTAIRGVFHKASMKDEFYSAMNSIRSSTLRPSKEFS